MSFDFDLDLDLHLKTNNKEKFNEIKKQPISEKMSLLDKLALLKNKKSIKNEEIIENNHEKKYSSKDPDNLNSKIIDSGKKNLTQDVSNLQKMLSKIKTNNEILKKNSNLITEEVNSILEENKEIIKKNSNSKLHANKLEHQVEKTINILDTVKINEHFENDFNQGKNFNKLPGLEYISNFNENHKTNLVEKNIEDNSNFNLSDSIQEIDDINHPSEEIKITKHENIDSKNNFNQFNSNNIDTNKELKNALENMNLFNNNKTKTVTDDKILNHDSLEMLIEDSNLQDNEFTKDKKIEIKESIIKENNNNISLSKFNNKVNSDKKINEKIENLNERAQNNNFELSKGSFDIDTDEEVERKRIDKNHNKNLIQQNKNNISSKNESMNNSDLLSNLINSNKLNNHQATPIIHNKNPFNLYRDSNFNDSQRNDDFNISQNLENLSKEIQEYKSSSDVNIVKNNQIFTNDVNNNFKNETFTNEIIEQNNNEEKKNEEIYRQNETDKIWENTDLKNSFINKNEIIVRSSGKINDSLFNQDKNYNIKNIVINKHSATDIKAEDCKEEQKDIKDLFKVLRDEEDSDDEIEEVKPNGNNTPQKEELPESKNKLSVNENNRKIVENFTDIPKFENKIFTNEIKVNEKENNDSILDIDEIPEIEENEEEDLNVVNLDKKPEEFNFKLEKPNNDNNVFNLKTKIGESQVEIRKMERNNSNQKITEKDKPMENKISINDKIPKVDLNANLLKVDEKKKIEQFKKKDESEKIQDERKIEKKDEDILVSSKRNNNNMLDEKKNKNEIENEKSYTIKAQDFDSEDENDNFNNNKPLKTKENLEAIKDKKSQKEKSDDNNIPNKDTVKEAFKNNNNKLNVSNNIMFTEESNLILDNSACENKLKNNVIQEIQETDINLNKDAEIEKQKKNEVPIKKRKQSTGDDNDRISVNSNQSRLDSSKYKIFIDFIDPEKSEHHLNVILGTAFFNERVKEKNIRFLLRRKSIIDNQLFTFFTLREYNIINKIKKIPINYSSKVEQILNEYQNENDYNNLFKKAIGDDNNNKQNLMKLLQKDNIKDKSFYHFDNISCLLNLEAFIERYNVSNEKFDMNWDPSKVLKNNYNEEEIIEAIYKKKEVNNDKQLKEDNEYANNIQNSEQNKILKSEGEMRINSLNDDADFEENKNKNKLPKTNNNNKNTKNINAPNESIVPYNLKLLKNEIKCWRESISDGDSFYRMFMFSLIEYYILNKNLHEIKKILFDVNRVYENSVSKASKKISYLFTTKDIDYSMVVIIFNLIIEALKKNQIEKAYDILLNAYNLENKSFDLVLIGYMRVVLWHMIAETNNSQEIIAIENKIKSEKLKKDYEDVNFETINTYLLEPFKLSFNLATLIFNINLEIIYFDCIPNPKIKNEKIKCSKVKFMNNSIHEIPTITLLYNFNCYGKFYTKNFYDKNKDIIGKYYSNNFKKVVLEDKFVCDKCGKKTKKVILKKYDYASCYECLKNFLELIIFERVKYYEIENFLSREFYCRPINIKQKFIIDDFDYLTLFGLTISSHIMEIIRKCCFSCDLIKYEEPIYNLDCTCNYCKTCLNTKISELTNNNFVLNTFEKSKHFLKC